MRNILVLDSGVTPASASHHLLEAVLQRLQDSSAAVVKRDLAATPIPHLTRETLGGVLGAPVTPAERATRLLSDNLIAELRAADVLVIGAPMYNFSLPTALRAWFDHVLRAGETFSYRDGLPEGLLTGKRAIIVSTRGGRYGAGPDAGDFQEPYLQRLLSFMGIDQIEVIRAEGLAYGEAERTAALQQAEQSIARLPIAV